MYIGRIDLGQLRILIGFFVSAVNCPVNIVIVLISNADFRKVSTGAFFSQEKHSKHVRNK